MKKTSIFHFTLVLKNVDANTPNIEDSLYEAGCDDALINFRNGAVYLEFDRKASSLDKAVISAIKNVRSSSIDAMVASVSPENLVSEAQIAKRLKMKRQTISLWIKGTRRKGFPYPIMRLSEKSPLWNWHEVVRWLYDNKIIKDKYLIAEASFFANINAVLEELDRKTRTERKNLLNRIAS